MSQSLLRTTALAVAAALGLALLAGCGKTEAPASQALGRVNGSEITVHQLENALRLERLPVDTPTSRQRVLERMIDRELAVQRALELKLDQRPEVMLRLDEMRRDVLANVWSETVSAGAPAAGEDAVLAYHRDHPELFAQRRIYELREWVWPADAPQVVAVRSRFKNQTGANLNTDAIVAALTAAGAPVTQQSTQRAAEQIPVQALTRLHKAAPGEMVLFETPKALLGFQVASSRPAPVSYDIARPRIKEYLALTRGKAAVEAAVAELRAKARIEYLGPGAPGQGSSSLAANQVAHAQPERPR